MDVPICKAATRPAMKFGVPMMPLLVLCLGGMMTAGWGMFITQRLWVGLLVLVIVAAALLTIRLITRSDDQRLHQMVRVLVLWRRHWRGMLLWRCRSYVPNSREGRDAWRP